MVSARLTLLFRLIAVAVLTLALAGCSQTEAGDPGLPEAAIERGTTFPSLPTPGPTVTPVPSVTARLGTPVPTATVPNGTLPGQILYVKGGQIYLWYRGESTQLTVDARNTFPDWLPNGQSFLYTRWSQGFSDLYRYYLDGRAVEQLTRNDPIHGGRGAWATQPVVAPDGERTIFVSDRTSYLPALWLLAVGNRGTSFLADDPIGQSGVQDPAWRPDGQALLATVSDRATSQLWLLTVGTGIWTQVTRSVDGAYAPAWHPSGDWIAYTQRRGTSHDIWISRPDGRDAVQVTTDGLSRTPVWALDGSVLLFASRRDNIFNLFAGRLDLDTGRPALSVIQQLTRGAGIDPGGGISWNPRDS